MVRLAQNQVSTTKAVAFLPYQFRLVRRLVAERIGLMVIVYSHIDVNVEGLVELCVLLYL